MKYLFILTLLNSLLAHAQSPPASTPPDACVNLVGYACASTEVLPDGTDLNLPPADPDRALKDVLRSSKQSLIRLMQSSDHVRSMTREAFGSEAECAEDLSVADCNQKLAELLLASLREAKNFKSDQYDFEKLRALWSNPDVQTVSRQMISEYRTRLNLNQREREAELIFNQVKEILIEKINTYEMAEEDRQIIINRVTETKFKNNSCSESFSSLAGDKQIAFHDHEKNEIVFCGRGLAMSNSAAYIANTLAHELGHSLNPSELNDQRVLTAVGRAFSEQKSCLASSSSVGASEGQINETFADWLAVEVTGTYFQRHHSRLTPTQVKNGLSNTFNSFCGGRANAQRISNEGRFSLIEANPRLRRAMGCDPSRSQRQYCSPPVTQAGRPSTNSGSGERRGSGNQ